MWHEIDTCSERLVLSEVAKLQSSLAEANHSYTQALMNLATAQADFEKALGRDR